jgi:putative restriction endonuclease
MSNQGASLDRYTQQFEQLRKDKNQNRYPEITKHAAPHKPLLLLSVLDRFAEGTIEANEIRLDPGLFDLFNDYWDLVMPDEWRSNIALPFYHLSSEDFWHLIPQPGSENVIEAGRRLRTIRKLKDHTRGARLDEDLHALLGDEQPRDILRTTLIESHFAESVHAHLAQQSTIHVEAFEYRRKLLRQARNETGDEAGAPSDVSEPARDQGFRQAVVGAYDHRCALSGIRILTADHHTAVEAAHIKPWSVSQNDDPRNGLALSKLCHWAFEEGLLTVTPEYTILTSPELTAPYNTTGTLDTLDGRSPHLPAEDALWPDPEYLAWHRDKKFRD